MTNVDGAAAFCERCGKPGHERAGDLEPCSRCGLLACAADRPAPGICVTCAEAARLGARRPRLARPGPTLASPVQQPVAVAEPPVDRRPPEPAAGTSVRRRLVLGTLGFAAAATLLAVLAAGNLNAPGGGEAASPPAGAVGFATGTPEKTPPFTGAEAGPSGSVASGAPVQPDAATTGSLRVAATSIPTWQDVLGGWHGQALVAVRNRGAKPVLVDAAASRYTVVAHDGSALAGGAFDAAVPPRLDPGATGYLVAGFTLVGKPGDDLGLQTTAASSSTPPSDAPLALRVNAVKLSFDADTVTATGTVANPAGTPVRDGVVAVVLVDGSGRPLAGMLDRASAGRLGGGAHTEFRAAQPPVPPVDRSRVRQRVAAAWGMPAP